MTSKYTVAAAIISVIAVTCIFSHRKHMTGAPSASEGGHSKEQRIVVDRDANGHDEIPVGYKNDRSYRSENNTDIAASDARLARSQVTRFYGKLIARLQLQPDLSERIINLITEQIMTQRDITEIANQSGVYDPRLVRDLQQREISKVGQEIVDIVGKRKYAALVAGMMSAIIAALENNESDVTPLFGVEISKLTTPHIKEPCIYKVSTDALCQIAFLREALALLPESSFQDINQYDNAEIELATLPRRANW
jgi:hypothetical protein